MNETDRTHSTGGSSRDDGDATAAGGVAAWLSLAAAPTFAMMALLTAVIGGGHPSAIDDASVLTGMIPMYLLMSAFHSGPWLKWIASRRSSAHA